MCYRASLLNSTFSDIHWQLEIGQGGSTYTSEIGQCNKSGLFPPEIFLFISSPLRSPAWAGSLDTAEVGSVLLVP